MRTRLKPLSLEIYFEKTRSDKIGILKIRIAAIGSNGNTSHYQSPLDDVFVKNYLIAERQMSKMDDTR